MGYFQGPTVYLPEGKSYQPTSTHHSPILTPVVYPTQVPDRLRRLGPPRWPCAAANGRAHLGPGARAACGAAGSEGGGDGCGEVGGDLDGGVL